MVREGRRRSALTAMIIKADDGAKGALENLFECGADNSIETFKRLDGPKIPLNTRSIDGHHPLDFGDVLPQISLDPCLQCDGRRRAPHAGSVQSDLNRSVVRDADQFDVPSVGLDRRADEADDLGHTLVHVRSA